jgi:hypothetical protein
VFLDSNKQAEFKSKILQGDLKNENQPVSLSESLDTIVNSISNNMKTENNSDKQLINDFINGTEYVNYQRYTNVTKGKPRQFTFETKSASTTEIQDLKNIYKSVNVDNNKQTFNGKVKFT